MPTYMLVLWPLQACLRSPCSCTAMMVGACMGGHITAWQEHTTPQKQEGSFPRWVC
jgi:hypothetical protein